MHKSGFIRICYGHSRLTQFQTGMGFSPPRTLNFPVSPHINLNKSKRVNALRWDNEVMITLDNTQISAAKYNREHLVRLSLSFFLDTDDLEKNHSPKFSHG